MFPTNKQPLTTYDICGEKIEVPNRYVVTAIVGKGAYGIVCSANDLETGKKVAIKKNKKIFQSDFIATRVLRELKILAHLNHPNIVPLKQVVIPQSYETFNDLYFVTELMETDLRNIIRSKQKLSDAHIQFITFQLLAALHYTHSASILHRDLKPENILINSDSSVKLCDFGLARFIDFDNDPTMSTNYVQTRWYRAPELLLNNNKVSKQADIWSVGCILAELLTGEVLFKGTSPVDQIHKIVKILGSPETINVKGSPEGIEFINRLGKHQGRKMEDIFVNVNPLAIDLITRMLSFNPENRISAHDALKHPYLKEFYDEKVVTECETNFDSTYEEKLSTVQTIKLETINTVFAINNCGAHIDEERRLHPLERKRSGVFSNLFSGLYKKK